MAKHRRPVVLGESRMSQKPVVEHRTALTDVALSRGEKKVAKQRTCFFICSVPRRGVENF